MPYTQSGFFCDRLIRERERKDGEGSLNKPLRFSGQDFNILKQECLQKKILFEDETFPATVESLGYKELGQKSNKVKNIVWKRPKVFFYEDFTIRYDPLVTFMIKIGCSLLLKVKLMLHITKC